MTDPLAERIRSEVIEKCPHQEQIRALLEGDLWERQEAERHVANCAGCTDWIEGSGYSHWLEEIQELLAPQPIQMVPMPYDGPCCRDWPHLYD